METCSLFVTLRISKFSQVWKYFIRLMYSEAECSYVKTAAKQKMSSKRLVGSERQFCLINTE